MHSHRNDDCLVNRHDPVVWVVSGQHVAYPITSENRNVSFAEPTDAIWVEARHADMKWMPWTHLGSTFISSGSDKQDVALPYRHILGFFAGFKFVDCDRVTGLHPLDPSKPRTVQ